MALGKVLKHWRAIGVGTVLGQAYVQDKNVLEVMADDAMAIANVKRDPGETRLHAIAEAGGDTLMDRGFTEKVEKKVEGMIDDASGAVSEMADSTRGAARNLADGVGGEGGGLFGGISSFFSNITSGISSLLSGGGSGINLGAAMMLPLAWFTFGKFGWLGKVASLAMVMYGLSNMFGNEQKPAVQQVRSDGQQDQGGRKVQTSSEAYENMSRQDQMQESEGYNVRSKM